MEIQERIEEALRKGHNKDRTRIRRNKKIKDFILTNLLFNKNVYFFTFTFNDLHYPINKDSFTKYLKRQGISYLLFFDEGKSTERAHYHGYVSSDIVLSGEVLNVHGFTKYRPIYASDGHECLTSEFYLSQKNYQKNSERLLIHYNFDVPGYAIEEEEIKKKMKLDPLRKNLCINSKEIIENLLKVVIQ